MSHLQNSGGMLTVHASCSRETLGAARSTDANKCVVDYLLTGVLLEDIWIILPSF